MWKTNKVSSNSIVGAQKALVQQEIQFHPPPLLADAQQGYDIQLNQI